MTIIQKLRAARVIRRVARQQGISTSQCRAEMVAAIETAWATTDPQVKQRQIELVGQGRVPTPEELIVLLTSQPTPAHRVAHTTRVWTTPVDR
jgi:hypothetical protein